ncbi:uncharacterized protein LOC122019798 [Zingiber officinale]|uniref:uncharacterized protein LOC122019798 n=1 Tax=Zingiber officinale TaxID=94328 RepID=UPI001C4B4E9B|nr:uncharacterized protein LOC122019798 [Zingiber officinale]
MLSGNNFFICSYIIDPTIDPFNDRVKDTATDDALLEFINLDSSPEEEEPRLVFKFQYQISNQSPVNEEEEQSSSETRICDREKGFSSLNKNSLNSETGLFDEVVEELNGYLSEKDIEIEEFTDPCSLGPQLDPWEGEVESSEVTASEEVQLKICGEDDEVLLMDDEYSDRKEVGHATNTSTGTVSCSLNSRTETGSISIPNSEKLDSDLREQQHHTQKTEMKSSAGEDYDELEALWEHQELIEQLRMELRKLEDIGLPTIFEESESSRRLEDLKPLILDESFLHEDPMNEMERSHWSYRERMRKFDILIYQKMYAIGILQLKDPLRSVGSRKAQGLAKSFSSVNRKSNVDPSQKMISEIQGDLEVVYVGQACLSWEFLRWQYEKAMPQLFNQSGHRFYHQVAGEFQQFQVNIQRFIENEVFEGPRLPYYIKSRCVLRNLLQVPVLKEDCLNGINGEMMEEIMKQSITIFWEFIKADKDQTVGILKVLMGTHVALQDPSDAGLLEDIQFEFNKKEKKLKDITRTCNCLVKFRKPKEDKLNQAVLFSQVDLKLVARVLRMPRITTEQLLWCHKKLSKIKFVERRIIRDPSFLLFPC